MDMVLERFWDKVQVDNKSGCWNWLGKLNTYGYGRFYAEGKEMKAFQFAYRVNKGRIPFGLQLDHLCRNRACVNPEHLEAVTCRINLLRGNTFQARNSQKTHCPKGHEYTEDNLVKSLVKKGIRNCRTCAKDKAYQYFLLNRNKMNKSRIERHRRAKENKK